MSFSKDTYWHISTALNPDKYGSTIVKRNVHDLAIMLLSYRFLVRNKASKIKNWKKNTDHR